MRTILSLLAVLILLRLARSLRRDRLVSDAWLRDNTRRENSNGIDQSRSTWPWRGWR